VQGQEQGQSILMWKVDAIWYRLLWRRKVLKKMKAMMKITMAMIRLATSVRLLVLVLGCSHSRPEVPVHRLIPWWAISPMVRWTMRNP